MAIFDDIDGIRSIKFTPKSETNENDAYYLNGSSAQWVAETWGLLGGLKSASRKFDIEFRTQYFYYFDAENNKYEKIEVEVPMFFIQEEVFDNLTDDVKDSNGIEISVSVNDNDLKTLLGEYDAKINLVTLNKDKYSVDAIIAYIGEKIIFTEA